jgi:hypothetical protein
MRPAFVLVGLFLAAAPCTAQNATAPPPSSQGAAPSSAQDAPSINLPVSLDRIRQGLKKDVTDSLLIRNELPADFRIHVLEQQKIDDLLSKLDFSGMKGPVPAGGLYAYEQQRRLFNPVDHPLVQPYAAFSGGELITIAIENLIGRYLGGRLIDGITDANRARAERIARDEVGRQIAAYCATRPDRADITICALPYDR